jgi:hypothetical protein
MILAASVRFQKKLAKTKKIAQMAKNLVTLLSAYNGIISQ